VTLDFDSTCVAVYGRKKPGAAVNYQGQLAYQPLLCSWAQRGRMLASELLGGTDSTQADEPRRLLARAVCNLPLPRRPHARLPRARGALLDLGASLTGDVARARGDRG
jgi:hypothetical protein